MLFVYYEPEVVVNRKQVLPQSIQKVQLILLLALKMPLYETCQIASKMLVKRKQRNCSSITVEG